MRVGSLEIEILSGVARLQKDMSDAQRIVGGSMANVEKSVAGAKRAMQALGVGLPLAMITDQVRRMTDQYTKLDAQLRLSTKSQAQYAQGMSDIRRISTVAQADLSATSMLYTRLMNVMQGTGVEQSKLATVTETVSFGLKAYGATAQEASSAALQLSQAMGANRLGGEEFRAVMEAMPNVMRVVADSMSKSEGRQILLGDLRQLSIDGKITADVLVKALGDPAIAANFKRMAESTQTVTGAWQVARNDLTMLVGEFGKSSGGVNIFIGAFKAIGETFKLIATYMQQLISLTTIMAVLYGGKFVVGLAQARLAQMALNAAHGEALAVNAAMARSEVARALIAKETIATRVFATGAVVKESAANRKLMKDLIDVAAADTNVARSRALMTAATAPATAANLRYAQALAAALAAEKALEAGTLSWMGKLRAFAVSNALGLLGLALWGAYSIADHLGWVDALFNRASKAVADLKTLAGENAVFAQAMGEADQKAAQRSEDAARKRIAADLGIKVSAQATTAELLVATDAAIKNMQGAVTIRGAQFREDMQRLKDLRVALGQPLKEAAVAKSADIALTHDQVVITKRYAELLKQLNDSTLTQAEFEARVHDLYGVGAKALKAHNKELKVEAKERAAIQALLEASAKYQQDTIDGINAETDALLKKIEQERFDTEAIGKTAEQLALLQSVRFDNITALREQAVASLEANHGDLAEIAAIKEQIKARKELKGVWSTQAVAQAADAQSKAWKEMWDSVDKTAHDTFVSIMNGGKDTATRLKEAFKNGFFDWLYSMTKRQWVVNISTVGTVDAADAANAATGAYGGGTGLMDITSSGLSMAMSSLTASEALGAASAYGSAALSATSLAEGISMATSGLSLAMPYIGAGIAVYSLLKDNGGTPTANTGNAAMQFDAQGNRTGTQTYYGGSSAGTDAMINNMQTSYMQAAMALGIGTVATSFSYGGNTGKNGQSPNFALGGGSFYQGETTSSDAAIQLAASRAVFSALQGSELPTYLANMFDGLTAGAMTQADIDNTLAFAGSVKQMREALLETRAPLEVLRANVDAGTVALATTAATFRTDFVAAIDAGITPAAFEQWKALGTAIDELAAADAQVAADNLALFAESLRSLQDKSVNDFKAATDATNSLRAFALSVRELQRSLWAGAQSPLSSTYSVTRSQFSTTNALAGQGDTNAQGALSGSATAFLDAAKLQAVSAIEYARDFAFVQNALNDTATLTEDAVTVADQQLEQLQQVNAWLAAITAYSATQSLQSLVGAATNSAGSVNAAVQGQADMQAAAQAAADAAQAQAQERNAAAALIAVAQPVVEAYSASNPDPTKVAARNSAIAIAEAARYAVLEQDWGRGSSVRRRNALAAAQLAIDEANALPAFAVGTNEVPYDMVANIHKGEEIKPRAYVEQDKAEREETNKLLREMKKELTLIKSHNYRMLLIEDKWDNEGLPLERAA